MRLQCSIRLRTKMSVPCSQRWCYVVISFIVFLLDFACCTQNISCYQCTRTSNVECLPNELLPCPANSDRCVTHIMKDDTVGFKIKRECGLGPCTFNDLMVSKGLGLDSCDRSKKEYFCVFCCKESGCNKSRSSVLRPPSFVLAVCSFLYVSTVVYIK